MIQLEFESIKDELMLVSQEAHAIVEEKQPKIENEPNFVESLEEKKDISPQVVTRWHHLPMTPTSKQFQMLPFIQKIISILLRWTRLMIILDGKK